MYVNLIFLFSKSLKLINKYACKLGWVKHNCIIYLQ